jgi:GNAT superfamily N-acetyltransferase
MAAELGVENEFVDFLNSYMENPYETSSFERLKARVKRATTDSVLIGSAFLAATKIVASKIGQIGLTGAAVTASTTEEGEASPIKTLLEGLIKKYPNVDLDVFETGKGLTLSKIVLPKEDRNKGVGSKILEDLTSYADKNNLTIGVTPNSAFGGNQNKLKTFYKKFGFRNNKGVNKDFAFRETMVRQPKKTSTERTEETAKLRAEANAQRFGENVNTSYRMQHQPNPDGARLDDMTGGGEVFPNNIYSPEGLRLYGDPKNIFDRESFDVIQSVKGKPNAEVTIYRAVPNDDKITKINRGDFVTLSPEYAKLHAESGYGLGGKEAGKVISQKVKVKDLRSDGNDLNEFGFFPENVDD